MTARLLATRSLTEASRPVAGPRSCARCGAYEAYLRTYRGVPSARNAAEFLLLDRLFPRSILFSVTRAEQCMREIEPRTDRVGVSDHAQRLLGQIRSELEYRPIADILDDLPRHMDNVQLATSAASRGDPPALLPHQRRAELGGGDHVNRLRIRHVTGFHYGGEVTASYNEARMLPVSADGQLVLYSNLEILADLEPATTTSTTGAPGSRRSRSSRRTASCRSPRRASSRCARARTPSDRLELGRRSPTRSTRATEYVEQLEQTPRTAPPAGGRRARRARSSRRHDDAVRRRPRDLPGDRRRASSTCRASPACTRRRRRRGSTRKGVCQDITHLAIGALRSVGIPARYVSRLPAPEAGCGDRRDGRRRVARLGRVVLRRRGAASTRRTCIDIGDRHVTVGRGRDYNDVAAAARRLRRARTARSSS